MFTGLIEQLGTVVACKGDSVTIQAAFFDLGIGESIAVSGVCLTVTSFDTASFQVDVSPETRACTTLGTLQPGSRVHLERSLRAGDRLGGHFVTGHVDGVARLSERKNLGDCQVLQFLLPLNLATLVASKGSIAVDGVSLTVNGVTVHQTDANFDVMLIPHTIQCTLLGSIVVGRAVNIEIDILARYVATQLRGVVKHA